MKYQIKINGMHCIGCSRLIKINFEEAGLTDVNIDLRTNLATFKTHLSELSIVKEVLDKIFKNLIGYSYENIKKI